MTLLWHDVYLDDVSESGFTGPGADRYKLNVKEFNSQISRLARTRTDKPVLLPGIRRDERRDIPFAITVDDGGVSYYTVIAESLEALGWRGHCMVTTGCIGKPGFLNAGQLRELYDRGHVIGTHSVSHPTRFSACSEKQMVSEWKESKQTLEDVLGQPVISGSIPGGYYSRTAAEAASESGLELLFTSEPSTCVKHISDCTVLGRFGVRRGHSADFIGRLAAMERSVQTREWIIWNSKKVLKNIFGAAYPRITSLAGRLVH